MKPELITTADGSHTLYLKELEEQYHSVNGAITESVHVFIKNAYLINTKSKRTVFEVGFGTGLNCLLTAIESEKKKIPTIYISIEKFPLEPGLINQLNYPSLISEKADLIWGKIHAAKWDQPVHISEFFTIHKLNFDLIGNLLPKLPKFDVIYFDAFGPNIQPEMWESKIFDQLFSLCNKGARISTYSAKGVVRRRLISSGFKMERVPGPPGKKEMLRGIKPD